MAAIPTPTQTQDSTSQLTKPSDWSNYMVSTALSAIQGESIPIRYASDDEAKMETLKTLNFHEAHDEYQWPDFSALGFDFAQTMRLRRALVHDVFTALVKNGSIVVGAVGGGTPDSSKRRRASAPNTSRKRLCKRLDTGSTVDETVENDSDDSDEDQDKPMMEDDAYLAETMKHLIMISEVDWEPYLNGDKGVEPLACIVHDALVNVWESPQAMYCTIPNGLKRKMEAWAARSIEETQAAGPSRRIALQPNDDPASSPEFCSSGQRRTEQRSKATHSAP